LSSLRKKSATLKKVLDDMEKYQIALNEHAIVSAADVKGNITDVNTKFCETSGYTKEELIGKNHRIVKSDEHSKEVFETMWRTICHGEVWHGEIKNKKKDGGFYWVNGTIVPFLNEKGKPYQYISIRTDITRQKELEKQLLEGQHFLKQVTGAMAQGLYALDEEGVCTFWNKEAEHILGWSEQELLNKNLHEIIHFQDENRQPVPRENCLSHNAILNNQIYSSDTEFFTHKDGRILPISIIAVPLLEQNNTIGTVAVFSDITKRKADEKIVHQAIINAQQASQAKSDFLANMSHEIRTPMNGIIGMTELTLETELNSEQREYLEIVKDSSYALLEIVNDILDFSKIESGKLVLEHIEFNIHELLKKTLAILIPKAEQKGVALSIENNAIVQLDFPLLGDPGRLRQVILNLVGNAIKFTLHGSVKVKVMLTEKTSQKCCLLFTVADTGIGIPDDKKDSIFDAFSQADTSVTRRFGGTGLGLSISKQFIELMSGKIWLESKPNEGTTFFFTCWFDYLKTDENLLEQAPPVDVSDQPPLAVNANMTVATYKDKLRLNILLAEDNLINQKLAKKLLEKQEHSVSIANNGLEALSLFKEQKFDLILMDFQMPEMNGLVATSKIRELEQQEGMGARIPIIAMTANAMKEDKDRAINAGMDAYVPKPINVQELLAEIARFFPTESNEVVDTEEQDDSAICNWDTALARLGGEVEILEMLVNLFLEEQACYLNNIKRALEEQDASVLQRELHTLRGVCATIGAERLEKVIKIPEAAAVQGDFAGCEQALTTIEKNLLALSQFLRKKIAS
jgi:PAS domain S-box-containing protein